MIFRSVNNACFIFIIIFTLDPCTESPCKNGGICKINEYSFKCNCKASYSGPTCEDDVCTDSPCLNGGTCEVIGDSFKCNCIRPYSGKLCDTEITSKEITTASTVPPKFSTTIGEEYKTTTKSTHPFFNGTTSTYLEKWTSQEPQKSSIYLNTTYDPLKFTRDMNTTTTGPKNTTSDFSSTPFEPKSSKTASYNITETTMNLNSTTDDLPKSINYTEITTSYNWTSPEPSKFTDLLNTTHAPPNTTFVMNITTIRLGFCSENSDCLNGGFCRRTKRFEYFCDCPPNFTGERCEVNLCGEMDRLCGSLGAICKIIGQNAICECPPNKIHNPVSGICEDGDRFNSCQVIYSQFRLAIHQNDHQARRRFVEWAQNEIAVVPDFHKRILFSDEAHFWLNSYVNKQNCRIWSEANPQVYVETPLHPEKLTVWCALWAGGIIGPYFKNDEGHNVTVNGDRYRAMITNFFIPELNNHDVQELWFQQDGATCHTARATIDLLKDTFGDRLISRLDL
ncbi:hypothetical protein TNCV_3692951 [Trichonephila clavipes]|nr:hypothetical protein TNCV_3692951 [Trichonephila clavipes]